MLISGWFHGCAATLALHDEEHEGPRERVGLGPGPLAAHDPTGRALSSYSGYHSHLRLGMSSPTRLLKHHALAGLLRGV